MLAESVFFDRVLEGRHSIAKSENSLDKPKPLPTTLAWEMPPHIPVCTYRFHMAARRTCGDVESVAAIASTAVTESQIFCQR